MLGLTTGLDGIDDRETEVELCLAQGAYWDSEERTQTDVL